ncbi:hypothetical protein JCM11251_006228 [Rhodosporidiobolus azoricus]
MTCPPSHNLPAIHRLPAEILISIFHYARASHYLAVPSHSASPVAHSFRRRINPVLAISHTCRAWRALAAGTAELWGTLHLDGAVDGEVAEGKVGFWVDKARRKWHSVSLEDEKPTEENAIDTLVLTNVQDWCDDVFSYLTEALELVHHLRLRRVHVSWRSVNSAANEHRQLQSFFTLLLASSSTLTDLTLHTTSHLRILFSLPRLGHTFTSLTRLEIRSAPVTTPASDAYLIPAFLPRYNGEEDWNPLSSLRTLILVGPIWRLRYRDGTVASPTLDTADVPALTYAELSSSTPQVHWSLLSSPSIKHLHLLSWFDFPRLPDPDISPTSGGGLANLTSLTLSKSPQLAARLLNLALSVPGLRWVNLERLSLRGAWVDEPVLSLFSAERAPKLEYLDLRGTTHTTASPDGHFPPTHHASSSDLSLPDFSSTLRVLDLRTVWWITPHRLAQELVFKGRATGLREVGWDGEQFSELDETMLRSIEVEVVKEVEEDQVVGAE